MSAYQYLQIGKAAELARAALATDGGHHRQWYLDQILRVLLGVGYRQQRAEAEAAGEQWEEGSEP